MKQITEDYVSFEIAQLLKEKGFVGESEIGDRCGFYEQNKEYPSQINLVYDDLNNSELECNECLRFTHQMALKWLREVHKLHIYAKPCWPQGDMRNKMSWQGFIVDLNTTNGDSQCYADSYEEAIENRIRFALKNLIKYE